MNKKTSSITIIALSVVMTFVLIAGCTENGTGNASDTSSTISVTGKIIDYKPAGGDETLVWLTFDTGDVYCVNIQHFTMNRTITMELEKSSTTNGWEYYICTT